MFPALPKNLSLKQLLYAGVIIFLLHSCQTIDVYEKTASFKDHVWSNNNKVNVSFTITDTVAYYNIYAVLRHQDAYHFNNIWLNIITTAPGDTSVTQQVNLTLGNNKAWLGSAMDDIIEHRIALTRYPVKLKKGNYSFTLQQIMREDPLLSVLNAGIRVEKAVQ